MYIYIYVCDANQSQNLKQTKFLKMMCTIAERIKIAIFDYKYVKYIRSAARVLNKYIQKLLNELKVETLITENMITQE